MKYQPWHIRRKGLYDSEVALMKEYGFSIVENRIEDEGLVVFQGLKKIGDNNIELELMYPNEYPHFPIVVYAKTTSLLRHQHPYEKNLCVIPHNQTGWNPSMTGIDMINQAARLLEDTELGIDVVTKNEVDAPEPWSNYVIYNSQPVIIHGEIPKIDSITGEYMFSSYRSNIGTECTYVLNDLKWGSSNYNYSPLPHHERGKSSPRIKGPFCTLKIPPDFDIYNIDTVLDKLSELASNDHFSILKRKIRNIRRAKPVQRKTMETPHFALIFPEENYERDNYRYTFLLGLYHVVENQITWCKPMFLSIDEHFRRIPDLSPLFYESALIIGLGSLGSAVALELGKCGLGALVLSDYDSLDEGNLVRHTGNIFYLGMQKYDILSEQIHAHFPFSDIDYLNIAVGRIGVNSTISKMEELVNKIEASSIIINTTADHSVSRVLDRLALEANVPIVHSWVSNGAWAGRIIRHIPGKEGCYMCHDNSELPEMTSAPIKEIYPGGCGFPTFAGASYDIYEVASQTVRIVINTLLQNNLDYNHIVISHNPPEIIRDYIPSKSDCLICRDYQ